MCLACIIPFVPSQAILLRRAIVNTINMTKISYFLIGRLDYESGNIDLLTSIYPAGSISNIAINILQYFQFFHFDTSLT